MAKPINQESIIASTTMTAISLMDTICDLSAKASEELGDPKLGEFITYRADQVKTTIQRAPITLEDLMEARDAAANLKPLLEDMRDRCGVEFRKIQKAKGSIDAIKMTTATAIAACALYNAASELVNTAGTLAAQDNIVIDAGGDISFGKKRRHGMSGNPEVTVIKVDEDGNTTEATSSMEDLPPDMMQEVLEALKKMAARKREKPDDSI